MSILRWLMSVLLFVGHLLVSVADGIIWALKLMIKIVRLGILIAAGVLIPVSVIYGLFTDSGQTLMGIIVFLAVGVVVFLIGCDDSHAGYGLSVAATAFFIYIWFFADTLLTI